MKISHAFYLFCFLLFNGPIVSQTIEKVHITTDKHLYAPEDTVWFKAYLFGRDNVLSDLSVSLKLVVSDTEGNKLKDTSWPILQGMSEGYFVAPKEEGKYVMAAISGQMVGAPADMAFTKDFFVRSELVDEVFLSAFLRKQPSMESDSLVVDVYSMSNPTKALPDFRFTYELWAGDKVVLDGRGRTDEQGNFKLKLAELPVGGTSFKLYFKSNERDLDRPVNFVLPLENVPGKIDLQFFPEGGQLVEGIASQVAFKAMAGPELPIDFKAVLIGGNGDVLDTISSFYQGMGSFALVPNRELSGVKIISPFVVDSLYALPKPVESGFSLSVVAGQDGKALVRVIPSAKVVGQTVNISIRQFDQELQTYQANITHRQFFELPNELLRPGVASVVLSSASGEPLAERLFFANADSKISVKISTDKTVYSAREEVIADIEVVDENGQPVAGSFSFAAIDIERSISPADGQPNLMAQILLSSELRGFVPTPNFYFSNDLRAAQALDLVMMTNGWRKFSPSIFEDPEAITGNILRNNNKRKKISDKAITITDLEAFIPEDVTVEGERFIIPSTYLKYKGDSFLITAEQEGAKDRFSIKLGDSARLAAIELFKELVENNKQVNAIAPLYQLPYKLKEDRFNDMLLLNTFTVSSNRGREEICALEDYHFEKPWMTKRVEEFDFVTETILGTLLQISNQVKGTGDILLYLKQLKKFFVIAEDALISNEKTLSGVQVPFRVFINCDEIPIIKMPGSPIPPDHQISKTFRQIDFSNLEAISIKEGTLQEWPIVIIHTKDDVVIYKPIFDRFKIISPYSDYSREYYRPVYDTQEKVNDPVPDLRTTIFWQASVITDENGKAQVRFYNADRPNKIQITVEGVDVYSDIGFSQVEYQVVDREGN